MLSLMLIVVQSVYAAQLLPQHETSNEIKYEKSDIKEKKYKSIKSDISIEEIVELFISLGIIPEDKAGQARKVLSEKKLKTANSSCISDVIKYNLYLGRTDNDTDGEVTRLQKWLSVMPDVYPEKLVTGYFGPATERAVQRYQKKYGIVAFGAPETTGYGVVGPKTRGKINACRIGSYKSDEKKEDKNTNKEEVDETKSEVSSITLKADSENKKVTWSVDGYSKKGFKVTWSKESGPTYPTRATDKYKYYGNPETNSSAVDAFDGEGTYYVRVCEYLGGACGVYSNEVTIEL